MKFPKILICCTTIALVTSIFFLSSCGDKNDNPSPNRSRIVKYELTGTYTGKLNIAYTLANGGIQGFSDIRLPWTQEVIYESAVSVIAFSGNGEVSLDNVPGQTVTIKIYSDNKVVKSGSATVSSDKVLVLPTFSYAFP